MTQIFNVRIYGEHESVIASGYPMKKVMPVEGSVNYGISDSRNKIANTLGTAAPGSGHDNFLKGIIIQFDIRYPQYLTPQLQRYSFLDIVSSTSKMHKIVEFDLDEVCNKYVDPRIKDILKGHISDYNTLKFMQAATLEQSVHNELEERIQRVYNKIISNTPMGLEMVMRCSTNLLQLKTIYNQRRHHKLKEDWGTICDWIESLEVFQKYCIKTDKK